MTAIGGTWYVMPTTFDDGGNLDLASQRLLTETVLTWGVDGITVLGVMGEATALSSDERSDVLRTVVESANGTVPIAVGCSAPAAHTAAALCAQAARLGADYAMVSAPLLLRDLDALPGFYGRLHDRVDMPLILQDEPAATGVVVPASMWAACLEKSDASALKLEDPPTANKISAVLGLAPQTRIFGGLGGVSAYHELARGAVGTMTGFSFPEVLRALRVFLEKGDRANAFATFARFLPLIAFEALPVVGLGIRKEILRRRGVIRCAVSRVGPAALNQSLLAELDEILEELAVETTSSPFEVD